MEKIDKKTFYKEKLEYDNLESVKDEQPHLICDYCSSEDVELCHDDTRLMCNDCHKWDYYG